MKKFSNLINQQLDNSSKKIVALTVERDQIPDVFFNQMMHYTFLQQNVSCEKLIITKENSEEIKRKLSTLFLGSNSIFWLANYHLLTPRDKKEWHGYLSRYNGPHMLFLVAQESEIIPTGECCSFPSTVDSAFFQQLVEYYRVEDEGSHNRFIEKVFKRYRSVSLDQALVLVQYLQLLGVRVDDFIHDWIPFLIKNEQSLFTLSELFLMKKKEQFFAYWYSIKDQYADQFWLSFWSDICWRSALFVSFMRSKHTALAKKSAFRLPYKFINYGWQHSDSQQLIAAHNALYQMDFLIKNGNAPSFELLFLVFFDPTETFN